VPAKVLKGAELYSCSTCTMVTHPRQHQQKVQCQATDSDSTPRACPISTTPKFQCTQISRKSYPNSTQGTAWDSAQVPQAVRSQPAKQLHRLPLHFFGLPFAGRLGFSGSASEGAAASSSYRGAMLDGSLGWWQCSTEHRGIGKHSHNSKLSALLQVDDLELGSWGGSCKNTQMRNRLFCSFS